MKERFEVVETHTNLGNIYKIKDNLISSFVLFKDESDLEADKTQATYSKELANKNCQRLNTEATQLEKSTAIVKVAGIKGHGVNLCNEFNFSDLWEVVEWVASNKNDLFILHVAFPFSEWWYESGLYQLKQHEMQAAIVDKIYELMKDAGMVG